MAKRNTDSAEESRKGKAAAHKERAAKAEAKVKAAARAAKGAMRKSPLQSPHSHMLFLCARALALQDVANYKIDIAQAWRAAKKLDNKQCKERSADLNCQAEREDEEAARS